MQWFDDPRAIRCLSANDEGGSALAAGQWPASIPAVAQLLRDGLELPTGVTFLVGENGSGKSTIVEAAAGAFGLDPDGGTRYSTHSSRRTDSKLQEWLWLDKVPGGAHWGFFLRAETMHGYYTFIEELPHGQRPPPKYHEMSHGESFLALLDEQVDSVGFYCLDEPEAALSFDSQLRLLVLLHEAARGGSQILCATHSPLLAALPGARIVELDEDGFHDAGWEDLALVQHYRSYLDDPRRYLRHLLPEA